MKLTKIGTDYIVIDENNLYDKQLIGLPRVHIIKLNFNDPTEEKVKKVISLYPKTNRFVVCDNIRIYNNILRVTSKKYYIENIPNRVGLITFFRRNNKVLLNFLNLSSMEREFVIYSLSDVLRNVEVVIVDKETFESCMDVFNSWNGNAIIVG